MSAESKLRVHMTDRSIFVITFIQTNLDVNVSNLKFRSTKTNVNKYIKIHKKVLFINPKLV